MADRSWRPGLPLRIAAAIGLISLVAALIVSIPTYLFARSYLLEQRENSAVSRALVNANTVDVALSEGQEPAEALTTVPSVGDSQPLLQVGGQWFTTGVTVDPDELPEELLAAAQANGGAMQRFIPADGDPYLAIAVPVPGGLYVEVFPLVELNDSITVIGIFLAFGSAAALLSGALLGRWAGARILRPLGDMATVAVRITDGDLSARVADSDDPDLGPISTAFNDMAATVENRLERERRFSANVSHELRSPLTGILGTAELLDARKEGLPPREATLVAALIGQVRRFSTLVLDLLELSQIGGDRKVQPDLVDIGALARFVAEGREHPGWLVQGDASARTDPQRLERILANLVDNADLHGSGLRRIVVRRVEGRTEIAVDDKGGGVAPADRERIFEPFNRGSKTDRKGSGLGLAIVSEQARLIGAAVTIEDAPGGGARFLVSLKDLPMWEGSQS
jgi:two-component system sensor histidine kinase MtrB